MAARPGSVPVTLVLGEEELLAERAVAEAVAAARERLGPGTSVEEVRGGGLPDGFAMGLATASLFGGGRVVVVQEADALDAAAREAVLALAADPAAATAVVLRAAAPGRQGKFFKDVQRDAATVLVAKLKPSERSSWLRAEVRRLGRKADEAAVAALVDTVGQDLRELAGAVAKLHVAVPPPTALTAAHVTEFLAQTADRGIFELTDAVFAADAATAVVLRAAAPGRQGTFFKEVQRDAATVLVAKLRPSERSSWLRAEVRRLGRKADEAAVAALVDTVGQDLRELAGSVAKLHVAVPPPTVLTAGHVTEFLAQTADRGIFELTDAVFAADAATALDRLDALIDQGEDPIRLLGFIASQLRLLLRVADHPELPKAQVASLLGGGVRDWQVDRARRQLRRFRPGDLHRALDLIAEADAHIRNGTSSPRLLLELLIARLAGAPAGSSR